LRVAVLVSGGVPNPTASGGAVTAWTIVSELVAGGHDISICVLNDPELYDPTSVDAAEREARVRALGADVMPVLSESARFFRTRPRGPLDRVRRAWRPLDAELYPNLVDAPAVQRAVEETDADAAFVYHFQMLAASRILRIPRFAVVGDPPHLSALFRFREQLPSPSALRGAIWLQAQARHQPRLLVRWLNECQASGAFAAHHAAWLRGRGADGCRYLHTPVPDPGAPLATGGTAERPTILLVGHMKGVVTLEGLRLFANVILPRLERELGADGFEVRVAGGYDPPPDLARALDRPSVRLLGHVEGAEDEFRAAHVLLVPNSITLGIRVRVVTAFSFGSCIVSHRANTNGIPELEHGRNALVGGTPDELADHVLRALADAELRRTLGEAARETYERHFAPAVAVGEIAETLERVAAGRVATVR
jgi:glycosyltransferase involved in cell wall biosynthesis